ncbi:hypothetical protein KKG48_02985 [Patescibacteria group bacterium]|nr:hypothetical protein [Patescibacteria group bacterium]MCG2694822.1 hypothetical protein [Candidatus Parcubacteria bacterium]
MNLDKKQKIFFIFALFLLGCFFVVILKTNYLTNIIMAYAPASLLTLYWTKNKKKKILMFATLATILFAVPVEIMARLADAWDVQSIFPRILDVAPIENLIYAFFNFLWPISFYEFFVDGDKNIKISKNFKKLVLFLLLLSLTIYSLIYINKEIVIFNYWQIGLFALFIPAVFIYAKNPKLLKKIILPTIFFGVVFFTHEMISMYLNHWWWPGEYLLPIEIYGKVFPLDDVIIWYILSTPVLIGTYEFFVDDFK